MEAFSPFRTYPTLQSFPTCSTFSSLARPTFGFPLKQFPSKVDLYAKKHVLPLKSSCFVHRAAFEWPTVRRAYSVNALTGLRVSLFGRHCIGKSDSKFRDVIARSELVGTGFPNSDYPLTELQLGSKIRGICFYSVTAIAAIFLFMVMVALHPFVLLFDRYRRKAHHMVAMVWSSLTIYPFINVECEGLENLPPNDTPAVYVSNHQSFLDIYTLLTLGRSFKFISKTGIFVFPIIGWAMFLLGVVPLRRMDSRSQLDCFKRCMDLVRKGASIFFFPEGTRSKDGKLGEFKKGAFSIAAKTGAPVVPITLMGTGKLMPPGMEGALNKGSIKAVIHKPIEGHNPELLCVEARKIIADTLVLHGYGVH